MKKNIKKEILFICLLLTVLLICPLKTNALIDNKLKPSNYSKYNTVDYVIDEYDINIIVNENNTFDIIETITAYFNTSKHGIFRTIPLTNNVIRLDGTTSKNKAQITNLKVDNEYSTSKENGNYKIKIGSTDKTITGKQKYSISYTYNIGKDPVKDYDEFYYNIIGPEWDTVIGNITFTITMPKKFDSNKLGFSYGKTGSTNNNNIYYNVKNNNISGYYYGILDPGEALTMRLELEDGYFVGAGLEIDKAIYVMFLLPFIFVLISALLWYKYGKDDIVVETVEFYPPNEFNSLEIGFLYKGKANNEDVVSLLIYLANKGYLKIVETEDQSLFSKVKDFKIIKLKEYDGDNINEKIFMNGLFFNKQIEFNIDGIDDTAGGNKEVTSLDLYNNFYITMNKILANINNMENKNKIFEKTTSKKSFSIILMLLISVITIVGIPTLQYSSNSELVFTLLLALFYFPFYAVGFRNGLPKGFRIIWLGFTIISSLVFFSQTPIAEALINERIYLFGFLFGLFCIIGMTFCFKSMPKRTKYGNEILGKIKGFKTFLETVEKEKLEAMVIQNPTYFYDILPYTYVLGISDKWISKFETISLQAPNWYDTSSSFSVSTFGAFVSSTMTSANSSMSSRPSSISSVGDSSGGGSSGGGSGGGGGGSW